MDIYTMVMCGMIAKRLLEDPRRNGIRAVSLSGWTEGCSEPPGRRSS
jgi:acetylglutamate kinase